MTVTIKSEDIGKYNIEISQDKFTSVYKVALNRCVGDYYVTDNERLYGTLKKANCRFAALKNKLRKEM